jgi:heme/copper-type cytochrome/quinol oxidase subunit 2
LEITAPIFRFSAGRAGLFAVAASLMLMALPASAGAAPLWPEAPKSPGASIAFMLFVMVFAIGAIGLIAYTLSLREARRTEIDPDSPAAVDRGPVGALVVGMVVFVVLAAVGASAFAKASWAPKAIGKGAQADTKFFTVTTFNTPSLKITKVAKAPVGPAYSIRVNAQQFLWRYQYPNPRGKWNTYSYGDLILPEGIPVMLDFTSSDVEAAWWVPQLGGSVTAMPGYSNRVWIRADKRGVYSGSGTVVNGTNYASQVTTVNVVPAALFELWVSGKQSEIAQAMTALGVERTTGVAEQPAIVDKPMTQEGSK